MRKNSIVYILPFVLSIIILIILIFTIKRSYNNRIDDYLKVVTAELNKSIKESVESYRVSSKIFYDLEINNNKILSLYAQTRNIEKNNLDKIRNELYHSLIDKYDTITKYNFRQLHFHLPDNRSFLRFHRPEKYGDDLSNIRPTIRHTNEFKTISAGFEEGRIINAFRYVYPLIYNNEHIGSVEVSVSYRAIVKAIEKNKEMFCSFAILEDIVNEKVFESEKSNYAVCNINGRFLNEVNDTSLNRKHKIFNYPIRAINKELSNMPKVQKRLENFDEFSVCINKDHAGIIISFCPVYNFSGKKSAYIISYNEDDKVDEIRHRYSLIFALILTIAVLLNIFVLYIFFSRRKVVQLNNMLKETNDTKDKFVSILAHDLRSPFNSLLSLSDLMVKEIDEGSVENTRAYASLLHESSFHAYRLIEEILKWARFQQNKMALF